MGSGVAFYQTISTSMSSAKCRGSEVLSFVIIITALEGKSAFLANKTITLLTDRNNGSAVIVAPTACYVVEFIVGKLA